MSSDNSSKTSYISLVLLGILAMVFPFTIMFDGMLVYGYEFFHFDSISESATTNNTLSMILPFILGGMTIFFLGYRGYDWVDRLLSKCMAIGATIVALQFCSSPNNEGMAAIGFFGMMPFVSNIVHTIGAVILMTAMNLMILCCFTKRNVMEEITNEKKWRNRLYRICGWTSIISTVVFVLFNLVFKTSLPTIFIAEVLMLFPCGLSFAVKGGAFIRDK
jgi:hypothetical protein